MLPLDTEIECSRRDESKEKKTIRQILEGKKLLPFWDQAISRRVSKASNLSYNTSVFDISKPAITVDGTFAVNSLYIGVRVFAIAMTVLLPLGLTLAIAFDSFIPFALLGTSWVYYKYEWSRATKKLHELAQEELQK